MTFNLPNYCIPGIRIALLFVFALACVKCGSEQEDTPGQQPPGYFATIYVEGNSAITASLEVNIDSVMYYNDTNPEKEMQGEFAVMANGSLLTVPVEVRTRGVTRKKMCAFPPLRIQLKKDATKENGWGDFRNYKLVTHCADSLREQELLLREYLVYKMYERFTDMSLRAQLLEMEYFFPRDTLRRMAVLIENEEEMCNRLGLRELDIEKTKLTSINFDHYKRFVLFQFMVGNTDWNLGTGHNTKYVVADGASPIVIPYDFDYSGFVNASYATPYETLPITNVRQRYLMYRGKKDDDFEAVRNEFLGLREEWIGMISNFTYLSADSRQDMVSFLEEFFTIIEKDDWKDHVFPS